MEDIRLRSYQDEMLEASLKQNIIVAMDTGSGKTHIAVARMAAALENSNKLIWFLAPTVPLCQQQLKFVKLHLPAYQSRILSSEEKVELWRTQEIWDQTLKNINIVVSTHAILADALTHGFVQFSSLGLLVFDEGK
jgi:ERCC4-related helicase